MKKTSESYIKELESLCKDLYQTAASLTGGEDIMTDDDYDAFTDRMEKLGLMEPEPARDNDMWRLNSRTEKAIAEYLSRVGFEIVERGYECDAGRIAYIATDGETGEFVFIFAKERQAELPELETEDIRSVFERCACSYFAKNPDLTKNIDVRFDEVAIVVINDDRALLRHHRNVLGD